MKRKYFKILVSVILVLSFFVGTFPAMALELTFHDRVDLPGLSLPVDETLMIEHGSLVLEAEDMKVGNIGRVVSESRANKGLAVFLGTAQWDVEKTAGDDIYTKIYVANPEEAGAYRVWIRYRNIGESGSVWINPNTDVWAAVWLTSKKDGSYYWNSTNINLHEGENFLAFRSRTEGYMDRIIITNNMSFKPTTIDDAPVYMTAEEEIAYWRTLWREPEIKPIEGHPRLLITKDNCDEIKTGLLNNGRKERYYEMAYEPLDCKLDTTKANNHNATKLSYIMAKCLVWVLGDETDPRFARDTINHMKDYLTTVRTPDDAGDITRSRGNILYTAAIVYDWMYYELTESDKEWFFEQMMKLIYSKEIGWPPGKMSSIASHAGEQEIFRDLTGAGIALYDEHPEIWDVSAGRMFEEMIPARRFFRQAGKVEFGNDYSLARGYSEVWADWQIQAMGYDSIYGDELARNWWRWRVSGRMPYGFMFPDGDMYSLRMTNNRQYYVDYGPALLIVASLYDDPVILQEYRRNAVLYDAGMYDGFFAMLAECMLDENVDKASKVWDNEPLSRISTYPQSGFVAKTGWQEGFESNAAAAYVDMHELWVGDHQMEYTGDFQVYYKGLLAMNTGVYNTSSQHHEGYSHRAISANTLLVYDPDETFTATWQPDILKVPNEGGQRIPNKFSGDEGSVDQLSDYKVNSDGVATERELILTENVKTYAGPNKVTPEFTYITGDLTNAYTDKVTDYHRSMVFVDLDDETYPAAFIVYDKVVSSNPDFRKVWLLHSQEKPVIDGDTAIIERTENGFGGRLVNKTLIPARSNQNYTVVGGDNNEMFKNAAGTHAPSPNNTIEPGKYRIELSPKKASKSDTFLNAMYVTDAGNNVDLPMKKIEAGQFTGVSVKDKIVLFQKYAQIAGEKFSLSINNSEYSELSVLIGGVKEGVWQVNGGGEVQNIEVTPESQVLMFKGGSGTYTITPAPDGTKADEYIYPQMQKREIGDFFIWHDDETQTAIKYGNFIYVEKPTKRIDDTAYIAVDVLKQFDFNVNITGTTATISTGSSTAYVTADSLQYTVDGTTKQFKSVPKYLNGTVYVNPAELGEFLGYNFTDRKDLNVLVAEKNVQ